MPLHDLLAPAARTWLRRAQSDLDRVAHPEDATRRTVAGPSPDHVLLLGNGAAVGFGVRTHELALPGQLARALAARTGRGAVVDVVIRRGLRIGEVPALLHASRPADRDALLLSLGATDAAALTSDERWRSGLTALLDDLRTGAGSAVGLLPVGPLQRFDGPMPWRRLVDARAASLDRITAEVVADREDAVLLPPHAGWEGPRTAEQYGALAATSADVLAPRLDALSRDGSRRTARSRRRAPGPEPLRQAAVDRSGLVGTGGSPVLDRLLLQARELLGVAAAAVTLVDGDLVVVKAASGADLTAMPRAIAPCSAVIRRDGPRIIPDLAGRPLAEAGWRFYAGYPLESPDGFRIGALCALDRVPHPVGEVDAVALADVAARVQAELWREMATAPAPA